MRRFRFGSDSGFGVRFNFRFRLVVGFNIEFGFVFGFVFGFHTVVIYSVGFRFSFVVFSFSFSFSFNIIFDTVGFDTGSAVLVLGSFLVSAVLIPVLRFRFRVGPLPSPDVLRNNTTHRPRRLLRLPND